MVDASTVAGVAKWIASSLIEEGQYLYGIEDLVHNLQRDLECMEEILQRVDVNPSLVKEDGQLRIFTKKIRDLAFRAEDAIDTYIIDVGTKVYMKSFFVKLVCLVSHSYPLHNLRKQIEAIQQEIQDARKRFETYGIIVPNTGGSRQHENRDIGSSSSCPALTENFIHLENEVVIGIDDVISNLANRLTNLDDDFKVLGIVGTGGAGKSTLATQLFRHKKVVSLFPHRAFVSVSKKWSRVDLIQRIFKQFKGEEGDISSNESVLIKDLHDLMKDRHCLVVLDDIWKKETWDDIYPIFPHSNDVGYRVILTTRIEEIPLHADNKCIVHEPQLLNEDQKWALFIKVAVEGRPHIEKSADQYEKLGIQMLEKCSGLPLVVVTLVGILRTKREIYEWEEVANACSENILKAKGAPNYGVVENMLELSYLDMPTYLKPCFLYLAIFPEDYDIEAYILIQMWIAEGFITKDLLGKGQKAIEDVGMRLLTELAQRCIVQVTSRNARGQIEKFHLHDLMRELCIKKANEYQFVGTISSEYPDGNEENQPRRITVKSRFKLPLKNRSFRTLVDFDMTMDSSNDIIIKNMEQLEYCKLLRVIAMRRGVLPKRIGKLVHLKFLSILRDYNVELPKSIKNLRNLLYLHWCCALHREAEVPNDLVCDMENLRGLILPSALKSGFENANCTFGLSRCKKLQSLQCGAGTWMMKDLPTLSPTVQSLSIHNISKMEEIEAIYQCPSIKGDHLCTLVCSLYEEMRPEGVEIDLQKLRHCKTLWSLELIFVPLVFGELGSPLEFPSNLVKLHLSGSKIEEHEYDIMQVLGGLSNLKTLSLFSAYNGKILSCKASAFPQLKELELAFLYEFEEWLMEEGAMARLTTLTITRCVRLKRLPEGIKSIATLNTLNVKFMPLEFSDRLLHGEDCYIVQHIPIFNF